MAPPRRELMLLAGTGNGVTPARRRVTDWMLKMEERVEFKKQRFQEPGPALCSERARARSVSAGVGRFRRGAQERENETGFTLRCLVHQVAPGDQQTLPKRRRVDLRTIHAYACAPMFIHARVCTCTHICMYACIGV